MVAQCMCSLPLANSSPYRVGTGLSNPFFGETGACGGTNSSLLCAGLKLRLQSGTSGIGEWVWVSVLRGHPFTPCGEGLPEFPGVSAPGTEAVVSFEPSSTLKPPAAAVSGGRASESRPEPWWAITMCACFAALPLTCCSAKPPSTDHRGQAHMGRLPWGMSARSPAPTECDCPEPGSKTPWNGRVCVTMAGLFAKDIPSACKGTQCWAAASDA